MRKIVEKSIEAALIKASAELGCSVVDLEYEVVQKPSDGFLGLGKKEAVIIVDKKQEIAQQDTKYTQNHAKDANLYADIAMTNTANNGIKDSKDKMTSKDVDSSDFRNTKEDAAFRTDSQIYTKSQDNINNSDDKDAYVQENIWGATTTLNTATSTTFSPQEHEANVATIRAEIESLFALLPFDVDKFNVSLDADNTLCIYIDGRDCALLIGERGYRYKALSYLLFNWINPKYGYTIRLEIAEFLKNQEEMIDVYLRDVARMIKLNGKAQTKTLDGILVYIALSKLREMFPDKYVSVRQNEVNEKYIIINDFRR